MLEAAIQRCSHSVHAVEQLCRVPRYALRTCGPAAAVLLPTVADALPRWWVHLLSVAVIKQVCAGCRNAHKKDTITTCMCNLLWMQAGRGKHAFHQTLLEGLMQLPGGVTRHSLHGCPVSLLPDLCEILPVTCMERERSAQSRSQGI